MTNLYLAEWIREGHGDGIVKGRYAASTISEVFGYLKEQDGFLHICKIELIGPVKILGV